MGGELRNGVAREGVALDEHRAIRRDRHVPGDKAHLRNDVHRLQAHRLDLLPVGDLRAGDALAGHRVEFKVRAHAADHARIQIDRRGHAAAIDVVHHLAVADADIGVDDAFLFVAQQRRDADGVDRGRAERGNRIMLDDLVLHNADARRLEARVERVNVSIILRRAFENPLPARTVDRLADDIEGVGFRTADEIAARIGIHTDSDYRIRSGLFYILQQAVAEGHIYLPEELLLRRAKVLLGIEIEDIEKYIMDLCMERKTVMKEKDGKVIVYPAHYYYMELNTAKMLNDLDIDCQMPEDMMEKRLRAVEEKEKIELDPLQHKAVIESIKHGLLILTGGPGTGKTTTINTMIQFFESEGLSILLAAPTGRAAKRMTEATGYEAQTIHRLLEVNGNPEEESTGGFLRNRENPLEADVIIIDEMSMVDLNLMHALLSAVVQGTRLILVGDVDQLPSVGPGSVLKDILSSERFHVVTLTKIFRQAGESDIIMNAHKINAGEPVELNKKSRDFFFVKCDEADTIIGGIIALIQRKLPQYVQAHPNEIQVMTPTRKGLLGVERMNVILQKYLNPADEKKTEREINGRLFREGDKVMQIKNNYQLEWEICTRFGLTVDKGMGVFNGDMGVISEINEYKETVEVEYDEGRKVKYGFDMVDELELAYAITVHKSQGSEYPAVILPLLPGPKLLYNRNLLYTAVTRARKCLTIIGSDTTFQEMIRNKSEQERYTSLAERIGEF